MTAMPPSGPTSAFAPRSRLVFVPPELEHQQVPNAIAASLAGCTIQQGRDIGRLKQSVCGEPLRSQHLPRIWEELLQYPLAGRHEKAFLRPVDDGVRNDAAYGALQ